MSIPRKDPNFTMEDLRKAADKFREAGLEYWEATHKAGIPSGAVVWIQCEDGAFCLFTRGEYRHVLLKNIDALGPTMMFGVTKDETKE